MRRSTVPCTSCASWVLNHNEFYTRLTVLIESKKKKNLKIEVLALRNVPRRERYLVRTGGNAKKRDKFSKIEPIKYTREDSSWNISILPVHFAAPPPQIFEKENITHFILIRHFDVKSIIIPKPWNSIFRAKNVHHKSTYKNFTRF